jgi:glycosyltransferase involved in cell wall biosynthesis
MGLRTWEHRVSAADAALYATANETLLDDEALRAQMGEIGRRRVEEQLAWAYSEPHLLAAYDLVFERHGVRSMAPAGQGDR